MSEYLFRGKSLEDKRWVEGDLFHGKDCFGNIQSLWIYEFDINHGRQFQIEVDPTTVGQYTEATDVNEKKIFDGDKVAFSVFDYNDNDTQYTGVVVSADGHWQIWAAKDSPYYGSDGGFDLYWVLAQDDCFEITGNIY